MGKPVVGIQVHHSVFLEDALRGGANARAGLRSAIQRTGDKDLRDMPGACGRGMRTLGW